MPFFVTVEHKGHEARVLVEPGTQPLAKHPPVAVMPATPPILPAAAAANTSTTNGSE